MQGVGVVDVKGYEFPSEMVLRSEIQGIEPADFGRTDVLFELIPLQEADIEYLDNGFLDKLKMEFGPDSDTPPSIMYLDDVQVQAIRSTAEAIISVDDFTVRIPRSDQYQCSMIAESWLSDELFSYAASLGDRSYIRGLPFPEYLFLVDRNSVNTALSAVIGRTPRIVSLKEGSVSGVQPGLYLSYPFFQVK